MTPSVHVRPATLADAPAIAAVHIRSWQIAYAHILPESFLKGLSVDARTTSWQQALGTSESTVLIAAIEGQVGGFVSFGHCRDADAPASRAEIWAFYADPRVWGTGVGRQLMQHALARMAQDGHEDTSLWVLSANARAIRFYERSGFEATPGSDKRFSLGGVEVNEIQLLKSH